VRDSSAAVWLHASIAWLCGIQQNTGVPILSARCELSYGNTVTFLAHRETRRLRKTRALYRQRRLCPLFHHTPARRPSERRALPPPTALWRLRAAAFFCNFFDVLAAGGR